MKIKLTNSKTLVILDNGHGIDTPGKRSPIWEGNTQLVEVLFPELVNTNSDGFKAIAYDKLSIVLLEGIKQQQEHIESMEIKLKDIELLRVELDEIKKIIKK